MAALRLALFLNPRTATSWLSWTTNGDRGTANIFGSFWRCPQRDPREKPQVKDYRGQKLPKYQRYFSRPNKSQFYTKIFCVDFVSSVYQSFAT